MNSDNYSDDTERITQPVGYRGEMVECDECGRLHVQGIACQHGGDADA